MGSLTNTLENEVLDHILKVGSYAPPATVYLGLSTADPTDDGSGWADPTFTPYARKSISFGAASARAITQDADVNFDACTAGSSTVSHWGLWSASSGGTLMAYGAFTAGKLIQTGYTPVVKSGEVIAQFNSGGVSTTYANSILDWLFDAGTLNQPSNIYISLHTTACSDAAAGTEVSGGAYARDLCNGWDTASGGASANTAAIEFVEATASWGTVTYAAIYDAITGGTYMLYLDVTDLAVASGDTARFPAGDLDVTLS